ncbi:protein windpipe [Onthophagus taurus]|uniref:protein windpipe n=1 Tax=Onthophagus taurus TaxID=166361 RepID=UPI0039BEAFFC
MLSAVILPLLVAIATAAPASDVCPEDCKCLPNGVKEIKAACMSVDFLDKLLPAHINQITDLDLSELSLKAIPIKLKKLKRLRKLDLTGNLLSDLHDFPNLPKLTHLSLRSNNLRTLSAKRLPHSVIQLDVSYNHITHVEDLEKLSKLEKIDLNENKINCDCKFLKIRDTLSKHNVKLIYPTKCYSPKNVHDIPLLHVYCVNNAVLFDDFLQNDEPKDDIEEEYVKSNVESAPATEDEDGSGSGEEPMIFEPPSGVPHCVFDCSTPAPHDPNQARGNAPVEAQPEESQSTEVQSKETHSTESDSGEKKEEENSHVPIHEEIPKQEIVPVGAGNAGRKISSDVEPKADIKEGEVQPEPKKSNTTYIVIGTLLVVMCALIAYAVIKRRRKRNSNKDEEANKRPPVEMKPLMKPNGNEASPTIPEKVPLMNGQNGHTENGDTAAKVEEDEPVEVRPSLEEPVTPDATKRVTIQAKEYPSPKSPVMIQRKLDDDGRVVVTPSSPDN